MLLKSKLMRFIVACYATGVPNNDKESCAMPLP